MLDHTWLLQPAFTPLFYGFSFFHVLSLANSFWRSALENDRVSCQSDFREMFCRFAAILLGLYGKNLNYSLRHFDNIFDYVACIRWLGCPNLEQTNFCEGSSTQFVFYVCLISDDRGFYTCLDPIRVESLPPVNFEIV